jgi:hypothetical protein
MSSEPLRAGISINNSHETQQGQLNYSHANTKFQTQRLQDDSSFWYYAIHLDPFMFVSSDLDLTSKQPYKGRNTYNDCPLLYDPLCTTV